MVGDVWINTQAGWKFGLKRDTTGTNTGSLRSRFTMVKDFI